MRLVRNQAVLTGRKGVPMKSMFRHTKIIFTVGPATESTEQLRLILEAGGNVCRLNMAHASHEWCRNLVKRLRCVSGELNQPVALMMDIKGPEVRTGPLDSPITLEPGAEVIVCPEAQAPGYRAQSDRIVVSTNYPGLAGDMMPGMTLLIDNGLIQMTVEKREGSVLHCRVLSRGVLGSRRHINLPGITTRLPSMTEKDCIDTQFGIELGVEYFAMSFVRQADDVDLMRRFLSDRGSSSRIIAKIEDQSAIANLEEIIKASDGLMVARGDLGIEMPFERLPIIQRRAVNLCLMVGRPVIIATHLLESMVSSPIPTRAEITDVANGVNEGADCLMLSGETTVGAYPVKSVEIMARTIESIEGNIEVAHNEQLHLKSAKSKILRSAVVLAEDLGGAGIVVFTRNGYLARVLSLLRPIRSPVYAFTDEETVYHQMALLWGVEPIFMPLKTEPESVLDEAFSVLLLRKNVSVGEQLVVIMNVLLEGEVLDTVQLRTVKG